MAAMLGCWAPKASRPDMLIPTWGSLWSGSELTSSPKKAAEFLDMMGVMCRAETLAERKPLVVRESESDCQTGTRRGAFCCESEYGWLAQVRKGGAVACGRIRRREVRCSRASFVKGQE